MYMMIEQGLREGISMVSCRYAKANNPGMGEGKWIADKLKTYLLYSDANNLYGWAMIQLGLRSISVIIESNRSVISFRSVNLIEFTDISVLVNYRSVSVNSISVSVFRFTEPIYRLYN